MVIFVSGGSGSGKSEFAESLITDSKIDKRTYIATMQVWDNEGRGRVQRHLELRAGKGFETLECPTGLERAELSGGAVLLEDLTNLFMNEFFGGGAQGAMDRVERGIELLAKKAELLVIVGNDIFSSGESFDGDMSDFIAQLGRLHGFVTGLADECYEVASSVAQRRCTQEAEKTEGMTLIIGGAYQGKLDYAINNYDNGRGITDNPRKAHDADVLYGLENWLRTELEPWQTLEGLLLENPGITIVCNEVGCGVVPMDESDRAWRERVGRVSGALAKRAGRVVRIWCGIPSVLKGRKV